MLQLRLARWKGRKPEIFSAPQGEGPTAGEARAFIRLAGCNLHCRWCDTPYTWNWLGTSFAHDDDASDQPKKYDKALEVITWKTEEVIAALAELGQPGLVITGGEPMLQQPALVDLLECIRGQLSSIYVEIETNGTKSPKAEFTELVDQFNVSPKLSNSSVPQEIRLNATAIEALRDTGKAVFKFVISKEADFQEVQELMSGLNLGNDQVFLMPEGRTAEQLNAKRSFVLQLAREAGFRVSDRLHILEHGDQRGT